MKSVLISLVALVLMAGPVFGDAILGPNDVVIAVDSDGIVSASSYPAVERPVNILDGNPATMELTVRRRQRFYRHPGCPVHGPELHADHGQRLCHP